MKTSKLYTFLLEKATGMYFNLNFSNKKKFFWPFIYEVIN